MIMMHGVIDILCLYQSGLWFVAWNLMNPRWKMMKTRALWRYTYTYCRPWFPCIWGSQTTMIWCFMCRGYTSIYGDRRGPPCRPSFGCWKNLMIPNPWPIHGTSPVYLPTNLPSKPTIHGGKYTIVPWILWERTHFLLPCWMLMRLIVHSHFHWCQVWEFPAVCDGLVGRLWGVFRLKQGFQIPGKRTF